MMTTWPSLRFVTGPEESATVLFDLCDEDGPAACRVLADGFTTGSPESEGDSDAYEPMYTQRVIEATLEVRGSKAAAMETLGQLARLLVTGQSTALGYGLWLRVQVEPEQPPWWFDLKRPEVAPVSWDSVYTKTDSSDRWYVDLDLPAEPFGLMARETLTAQVVSNDPTAATNPCRITLPAIKGDAPAPLRFDVNPSNTTDLSGFRLMFSLLSTRSAVTSPVVWKVGGTDGWTAGADTAASTADALAPGGTRRIVDFATTPGMATRISGPAPATLPNAKYKVLVWVKRTDTSSTFALRFGQSVAFSYRYGRTARMDRAASAVAGHSTWVDLGEFQHPFGHHAPAGQSGFAAVPDVSLQAQRLSGSGALAIAAIMLVPVDSVDTIQSRTLFAEFNLFGIDSDGGRGIFDGDTQSVWAFNKFAVAVSGGTPWLEGTFPSAVPGAVNTLHFLQQVNAGHPFFNADTPDVVAATTSITVSYHPRVAWVAS